MHDVRACGAMDDARAVLVALERAEGLEQLDDVGLVVGVAASGAPVWVGERALLGVHDDQSGVGMVDRHLATRSRFLGSENLREVYTVKMS